MTRRGGRVRRVGFGIAEQRLYSASNFVMTVLVLGVLGGIVFAVVGFFFVVGGARPMA